MKLNPNDLFRANPNIVLFLLTAMGLSYVLILAFFLQCFLQVRSQVQHYKAMFKLLTCSSYVEPTADYDRFQICVQAYDATHPDKLDQSSSLGVTSTSVMKPGAHFRGFTSDPSTRS